MKNRFLKGYTPRWIVFIIDLIICFVSIILAFYIRFNLSFDISGLNQNDLRVIIPIVLAVRAITFYMFKTYSGIVRYTSLKDTERIISVVSIGSAILVAINLVSVYYLEGKNLIPYSVIIIDLLVTTFVMISSRMAVKSLYHEIKNPVKLKENTIILGAEKIGLITKRTIERDEGEKQNIVGFIETKKSLIGKKLESIPIHAPDEIDHLMEKHEIDNLVIASKYIDIGLRNEIAEKCIEKRIKVMNVPEESTWINGDLSVHQIRGLKIEDLLERKPIQLDTLEIKKEIINKVILVTGAAGSIGSGLVKQIAKYYPQKIILIDQAESPLYDIELELKEKLKFDYFETILCDMTNYSRLSCIFKQYRPNIVYHAAAYKHVPMMEMHPMEAIGTNVKGTKNLADLSNEHGVSKFVMVSTDKAVNPTNVMGASKRIAEIYVQSLNNKSQTNYITTRFGNVLGSNGSVIPRFKRQIETGGPVTITHPDVTRYFMTIPEACQLVLEAGTMGQGGEIFLFDMGRSVKILDLAKRMINLYGLRLDKDIRINYTGLRPGEKLYEELLTDKENTIPTHHQKIMIGKNQKHDVKNVMKGIEKLITSLDNGKDNFEIVKQMKLIVPEFKSQNSIYEELDLEVNKIK